MDFFLIAASGSTTLYKTSFDINLDPRSGSCGIMIHNTNYDINLDPRCGSGGILITTLVMT